MPGFPAAGGVGAARVGVRDVRLNSGNCTSRNCSFFFGFRRSRLRFDGHSDTLIGTTMRDIDPMRGEKLGDLVIRTVDRELVLVGIELIAVHYTVGLHGRELETGAARRRGDRLEQRRHLGVRGTSSRSTSSCAAVFVGFAAHLGGRALRDFELRDAVQRIERVEPRGEQLRLRRLRRPHELLIDGAKTDDHNGDDAAGCGRADSQE